MRYTYKIIKLEIHKNNYQLYEMFGNQFWTVNDLARNEKSFE